MTETEFIKLISFCILMENNEGILGKAPYYVLEKWETRHVAILDRANTFKLEKYKALWSTHIDTLKD